MQLSGLYYVFIGFSCNSVPVYANRDAQENHLPRRRRACSPGRIRGFMCMTGCGSRLTVASSPSGGGNLGPPQRSALVGRSGDPCSREVVGFRLAAVFYEKDYREAFAGAVRVILGRLQLADSRERRVEKVTCGLHLVGYFQRIVRQRHPFQRFRDLVAREECVEVRSDDSRKTGGGWP